MKTITTGVFSSKNQAERAVNELHSCLGIPLDNISFLRQNIEEEDAGIEADDIGIVPMQEQTIGGAAVTGAITGGSVCALVGIATVAGLIPVFDPIFSVGSLLAGVGIDVGIVGKAIVTGAVAGGSIGALTQWGVYQDRANIGDVLVTTETDRRVGVVEVLKLNGAYYVDSYSK